MIRSEQTMELNNMSEEYEDQLGNEDEAYAEIEDIYSLKKSIYV